MGICSDQVLFGINSAARHSSDGGHAHRQTVGDGTELLEPFGELERMWREADPAVERVAPVGVDAEVLLDERVAMCAVGARS